MSVSVVKYIIYGLVTLICGILLLGVYRSFFRKDVGERHIIISLYSKIQIGDERKFVRVLVDRTLSTPLQVREGDNHLSVLSPFKFGANNWNLYVAFRDGRVTTVFIRNSDNFKSPPANAPPDKGNYHQFLEKDRE